MKLPIEILQIFAHAKKDFEKWTTYKTMIVTQLLTVGVGVLSWGFNALYRNRWVEEYQTYYISFLIVGIIIGNVIMPASQAAKLNPNTLEAVLMTGIRMPTLILGNIAWIYIFSILTLIPQLLIGIFWFGAQLNVNLFSMLIAFIISAIIMLSLSTISLGVRLVTKSTDPATWSINMLSQLLAGMTFPFQFLDETIPGISTISWMLPQTWIYHLTRLSTLTNASVADPQYTSQFMIGALYAVILMPIGYFVFRWGLNKAKQNGTLGWQ
jgi:ABC-2 type transport system permease protein